MGYYIQGPQLGKADFLITQFAAREIAEPKSFDEIPTDKALIVVVDNGMFEAAGYCYSKDEFAAFVTYENRQIDARRRRYVLMDKQKAEELSGFGVRA